MNYPNKFSVEITRDVFDQKVAPLIASGDLKAYTTEYFITYLASSETGLNEGFVGATGDVWRAFLLPSFAEKLGVTS